MGKHEYAGDIGGTGFWNGIAAAIGTCICTGMGIGIDIDIDIGIGITN
jgi:hypothetical protein